MRDDGVCTGDIGNTAESKYPSWGRAGGSTRCGVVLGVHDKTCLGDIVNVG